MHKSRILVLEGRRTLRIETSSKILLKDFNKPLSKRQKPIKNEITICKSSRFLSDQLYLLIHHAFQGSFRVCDADHSTWLKQVTPALEVPSSLCINSHRSRREELRLVRIKDIDIKKSESKNKFEFYPMCKVMSPNIKFNRIKNFI